MTLAIVSLGLFLSPGRAAVVINVDLNGSSTSTLSGQGAYADPGNNYWNGFNLSAGFGNTTVSTGALLDSTGASTGGVQMTLNLSTGEYWQGFNYAPPFAGGAYSTGNAMMDDMIYMLPGNFTNPLGLQFTLSNLTPNTAYTLYLYGDSGTDPKATAFTVNGTTLNTTGRNSAVTPAIYTQGTDYALFSSVTSDSFGNLVGYFTQASGSGQGRFSGLQLVAVPEPQTWALAALGASAIVFRLRRRQLVG